MIEGQFDHLIWVIADNTLDQQRIAGCFRGMRIGVKEIGSAEALAGDHELPAVVVISTSDGETSGIEFARRFRAEPVRAGIPILLASPSYDDHDFRLAALENGVHACLAGPVIAKELLAHVTLWIRTIERFKLSCENRSRTEAAEQRQRDAEHLYCTLAEIIHWPEQRATNLLNDHDVKAVVVNFRDVTRDEHAKKGQQVLRERKIRMLKHLQMQIQRMPIGLIMCDPQTYITDWNPAAERIFGLTKAEVLGKRFMDLHVVPDAAQEHVETVISRLTTGDMTAHSVNQNLTKDGRSITCEWFNTPLLREDGASDGILAMVVDITEREQLEEQFRQAQKMEAVGMLAGGVAHDFNNLLTVINGCSELLVTELTERADLRSWALDIQHAGEHAAKLTDQLLRFSRKQIVQSQMIDVNDVLIDIGTMLRRMVGEDVDIQIHLCPQLPRVQADESQLGQIVMNLAVNARDAMPCGGRLCISTDLVTVHRGFGHQPTELKQGNYVRLRMSDSGEGIDDAIIQHICDPFFTTKPIGRGTGLGLSTVYGIVMQFDGHLDVRSKRGHGSEFTILLPTVEPGPKTTPPSSRHQRQPQMVAAVNG